MIYFKNDYQEGCAKEILDALIRTNLESTVGYGLDNYTLKAKELIQKEINCPNADIHFLVGGTQTNLCAISVLRPYEAVISCDTGHINVHECGAIENTGHKIISVPNIDGKLDLTALIKTIEEHKSFHMLVPKMVYISNSTELGTIYNKKDLIALREICNKYNLYLFVDGARLGSALTSKSNDLTMADLAKYCDMFYIGGTKNGTLFGEALIIINDTLKPFFKYIMKQNGAVLAKGRLLGVQFMELFTNNLFYNLAKHANLMAENLRKVLAKYNIGEYVKNDTNQIFIKMNINLYNKIKDKVEFEIQKQKEDYIKLRLVTSFATTSKDVEELDKILKENS